MEEAESEEPAADPRAATLIGSLIDADLTPRWDVPVTNANIGGPSLAADGTLIMAGVGSDLRAYRTESSCPEDIAGDDGVVDINDLLLLLGSWDGPGGDIDGDGVTDINDLLALLAAWGVC